MTVNADSKPDMDTDMADAGGKQGGEDMVDEKTTQHDGGVAAMQTDKPTEKEVTSRPDPHLPDPDANGAHTTPHQNGHHVVSPSPPAVNGHIPTEKHCAVEQGMPGQHPHGDDDKTVSAHVVLHAATKVNSSGGKGLYKLVDYSDDEDDNDKDDNGEAPSFPRRCVRPRSSPSGPRSRKNPISANQTTATPSATPLKPSNPVHLHPTNPLISSHTSSLLTYATAGRISLTPPPPPPTSQLNKLAFSYPGCMQPSLPPSALAHSSRSPLAPSSRPSAPHITTSPPATQPTLNPHNTAGPVPTLPSTKRGSNAPDPHPHNSPTNTSPVPPAPASSPRSTSTTPAPQATTTNPPSDRKPPVPNLVNSPPVNTTSPPSSTPPSSATIERVPLAQRQHQATQPAAHTPPTASADSQKLQQFHLQHLLCQGIEEQKQRHLDELTTDSSDAHTTAHTSVAPAADRKPSQQELQQAVRKAREERGQDTSAPQQQAHDVHAEPPRGKHAEKKLQQLHLQQALLHTLEEQKEHQMQQNTSGESIVLMDHQRQQAMGVGVGVGGVAAVHKGRAAAAAAPPQEDVREILECLRELKGMYLPLQYMHTSGVVHTVLAYQQHPHPVVCWLAKQVAAQWTWMVSTRIHLMASKELMEDPVVMLETAIGSSDTVAPAVPCAVAMEVEPCNSSERTPRHPGWALPTTTNSDSGGRGGRRTGRKAKGGGKSNLSKSYASKSNVSKSSQGGGRQLSYSVPGGTGQSGSVCSDAEDEVQGTATKVKDEIKQEPEEPSPQPAAHAAVSHPSPITIPDPPKVPNPPTPPQPDLTTPPQPDPSPPAAVDPEPPAPPPPALSFSLSLSPQPPKPASPTPAPASEPTPVPLALLDPATPPPPTVSPTPAPAAVVDVVPSLPSPPPAAQPEGLTTVLEVTPMEVDVVPSLPSPTPAAPAGVDEEAEAEEKLVEADAEEEEEEDEDDGTAQGTNHVSTGGKKKPPGIAGKTRPAVEGATGAGGVGDDDEDDEDEDDSDAGSDAERPAARKSLDGKTLPRGREGEKTIPRWNPGGDDEDEEEDEEEEEE